ncbi:SRPBCC family protein [Actinomadura sp. NAK00032]|uniref:SRPBCC family protein n=1 Tax=Actinomadura sp. NAK00032 TaxID=2742128 RepID=UPI001591DAA6|nr:SRPBCC family protein [Actinomadura sp. NAK00032]QKW38804.1 SRPBCC family protein [Actinomadura sp. NAK00032]
MARGILTGRSPVGQIAKRLPGGRRGSRVPGLGRIGKSVPKAFPKGLPKNVPGGRTAGTAGGVLLGAGAAVAASRALAGRRGEQSGNTSGTEEKKGTAKATKDAVKSAAKGKGPETSEKPEKSGGAGESSNGQGVLGRLKDTVGSALPGGQGEDDAKDDAKKVGGGGGGGKKVKVTNIVEHIDVGAPRRLVYDQWTRFQDYPSFMKKVISVEQADEAKLNWKAKIFWSARTWESTIVEQVPDEHVVWRSKGPKGHVDGTVSFHELSPNLTRVLVVLEYHPQGFMERTGNLWRAQGRRARLELKHFRRYVMTQSLTRADEVEGWRGEIRDGEVVRTHEDAIEDEKSDKPKKSQSAESTEKKPAKGRNGSGAKAKNEDAEKEYEEV